MYLAHDFCLLLLYFKYKLAMKGFTYPLDVHTSVRKLKFLTKVAYLLLLKGFVSTAAAL